MAQPKSLFVCFVYAMVKLLVVFAATTFSVICSGRGDGVEWTTVKTTKGLVQGRAVNTTYVFQAIPYVQPPVNGLRFMVPRLFHIVENISFFICMFKIKRHFYFYGF